ncbi:hypothetical protein AgCh_023221 [Apium graveolens]
MKINCTWQLSGKHGRLWLSLDIYDVLKKLTSQMFEVTSSQVANHDIIGFDSDDESDNPTRVEAPVPWFSVPLQNISNLATTDVNVNYQLQPSLGSGIIKPEASQFLWSVDPQGTKSTTSSIKS